MIRYGCRFGQPHDLEKIFETPSMKVEKCKICRVRFRWNKGYKKRVDNPKYLEAHARNYAQKGGRTNRLFMRLYEPEKTIIVI